MRDYLGLSEVGMCARRVCYNHDPQTHVEPDPDTQALMDMGSFLEPYVRLRRGNVVDDQLEVTFGPAKGHIDGRIPGDEPVLWECKVTTAHSIRKWRNDGLPRYYLWQVQGYLAGLSAAFGDAPKHNKCLLDALDRFSGHVSTFEVEADPEVQAQVLRRAENLARALENGPLPEREFDMTSPECGFYPYKGICWGEPETDISNGAAVDGSNWPGFADLLEQYEIGKQMQDEGKEMEEAAKERIVGVLKNKDARVATCNGFKASYAWVEQEVFDQKAFRANHEDLWAKYRKGRKFPRLRVDGPKGGGGQ